jgi:hypothetical protein
VNAVDLGDRQPGEPTLPPELQRAVDEWSRYAGAVAQSGRTDELELVRRRGRQLASRVAGVLGRPVEYVDPVDGQVESIEAEPVPLTRIAGFSSGPTPWTTGLIVSGFCMVFVAIADIVLSRAFAAAFGGLWIPANLLVGLGLAPTIWLVRETPFWRWIALGAAAGLVLAWVALLLELLGS